MRDKHGGAEHRHLTRVANERSTQAVFDQVRALHKEGRNVRDIARQTGFDRRTVAKWIRADALPERSAGAPKTTSRGISKIIYLAAGQRVASAADDCSRKSKRAVTHMSRCN